MEISLLTITKDVVEILAGLIGIPLRSSLDRLACRRRFGTADSGIALDSVAFLGSQAQHGHELPSKTF